MRFYFTQLRGTGTEIDPFYCPLMDIQTSKFNILDLREYPEIKDGELFVWTNNTDAEHAEALLQVDIEYLATEDSVGTPVELTAPVSVISAANRAVILQQMEDRGIPTDGIAGTTQLGDAMRLIFRRVRLIELLRYIDLPTNLTLTIADIPALKRKALQRRLTNTGFDLSNITGTTTIRAALQDLLAQPVNFREAF